jgi:hypothetical protein
MQHNDKRCSIRNLLFFSLYCIVSTGKGVAGADNDPDDKSNNVVETSVTNYQPKLHTNQDILNLQQNLCENLTSLKHCFALTQFARINDTLTVAFAELEKTTVTFVMCVCPSVSTVSRLPWDGFS